VGERARLGEHPHFNPALRSVAGWRDGIAPAAGWLVSLPGEAFAALARLAPPPGARDDGTKLRTARRILADSITLRPVPDSRVIAISATTGEPALSARVVNAVAREYVTAQLDAKLAAAREATTWLTARVAELEEEVASAEAAVSSARARLAQDSGGSRDQIEAELHALETAIAAAATERATAETRYRALREAMENPAGAAASAALDRSDVIAGARTRAREIAMDRAALAALVPPGHERLERLDAQVAAVNAEIGEEAERIALRLYSEVTFAAAHEERLRRAADALEARLTEQSAARAELRRAGREADASRLIFQSVLARLKETTQQEKLSQPDAVIISPAEPPGRADSAPGERLAALGAVIGAMAGLAFALVVDGLSKSFRALEDVEETTGLAVVGTTPFLHDAERYGGVLQYVLDRPSSALAEAVRSLRTSLFFSAAERPPQVVMFTSSVPAEGKSTTSLLLAVTSAQTGRSTIIVDCDMRRPALGGILGAAGSERGGLRGVLDGRLTPAQACLTDPDTGLTILPTLKEPGAAKNAADTLASGEFGALLERLRRHFECIILDAPPTLSVTDARLVAQRADAAVYCIQWDATPRETVMEGLRLLSLVRCNVVGTIVTMVDTARAAREGGAGGYNAAADPYHIN